MPIITLSDVELEHRVSMLAANLNWINSEMAKPVGECAIPYPHPIHHHVVGQYDKYHQELVDRGFKALMHA